MVMQCESGDRLLCEPNRVGHRKRKAYPDPDEPKSRGFYVIDMQSSHGGYQLLNQGCVNLRSIESWNIRRAM